MDRVIDAVGRAYQRPPLAWAVRLFERAAALPWPWLLVLVAALWALGAVIATSES